MVIFGIATCTIDGETVVCGPGHSVDVALGQAHRISNTHDQELVIVEAAIDGGPIMKRIQPRARGTAYPIKRRCAHIRIAVSDEVTV